MSKFWEMKLNQEAESKTLDLYIYSDVEGDSIDFWTGETIKSETSANTFREKLEGFGELDNINIYINSLGGSCKEGHAIYNILKRCKAYKTVYIDGYACSVASVIAMAGDKIIMPKNTIMMIHNAWTWASGNAKELRKVADDMDVLNSAFINAYLNKVGDKLSQEKLQQMLDEETFLNAEQCIEFGLADEFADYDVNIESAKQALQKAKETGAKQYADRLDKIVALVNKEPAPPQEQKPKQENKALHVLEMCVNGFCSQQIRTK